MKEKKRKLSLERIDVQSFATETSNAEKQTIIGGFESQNCTKTLIKLASRVGGPMGAGAGKLLCAVVEQGRRIVYESLHGIYQEPTVCAICPPGGQGATTDGPVGVACGLGCPPGGW